VIVPSPAWPNFAAALGVANARAAFVPLTFDGSHWWLDIDRLAAAIGPRTRAIFINSPSNPTGWMATKNDLQAILDLARRHGLWIVADEVYNRFVYDGERAPSFYDVATDADRILYVNTFSKNWAMTGWRIGWIGAPAELGSAIENLIQYSTSGVATFLQHAAVTALDEGDDFVREQVERARAGRDVVCRTLAGSNRVRFAWPDGAFYLFFEIAGEEDTSRLGTRLIDETGVGLAPGTAFGAGGESFMRLCFARRADELAAASRRLSDWLQG
jgi:aspartate/methionine/tyrosine aminotransferase